VNVEATLRTRPAAFDVPGTPDIHNRKEGSPALPVAVDLRATEAGFPPVYAQGQLNSCAAQVLAALLYHDMRKRDAANAFEPSRLFLYYNERHLRRQIGQARYGHRGAPVRLGDAIASIRETGFCAEAQWPYVETQFDVRPAASLYDIAARHRGHVYRRIDGDVGHLKACLAQGHPFAAGIVMSERFLGPGVRRNGIVAMPAADEPMRGGHAVVVVGYDDDRRQFIARNSFGPDWGDSGHCYLPYAFLGDPRYGFDFWIVDSQGAVGAAASADDTDGDTDE
jgi:C1A family cysteine protease